MDGMDEKTPIPTSFNTEEYQDSKPSDSVGKTSEAYSPINSDDGKTIEESIESKVDTSKPVAVDISKPVPVATDTNDEQWQSTAPSPVKPTSIPTEVNTEKWQSSTPLDSQPIVDGHSESAITRPAPKDHMLEQASHEAPITTTFYHSSIKQPALHSGHDGGITHSVSHGNLGDITLALS